MTVADPLANARTRKAEADKVFRAVMNQQGEHVTRGVEDARRLYQGALAALDAVDSAASQVQTEVAALRKSCHMNITASTIQDRSWKLGLKHVEQALLIDPKDIKALHFRGFILLDGYDRAAEATASFEEASAEVTRRGESVSEYQDLAEQLARAQATAKAQAAAAGTSPGPTTPAPANPSPSAATPAPSNDSPKGAGATGGNSQGIIPAGPAPAPTPAFPAATRVAREEQVKRIARVRELDGTMKTGLDAMKGGDLAAAERLFRDAQRVAQAIPDPYAGVVIVSYLTKIFIAKGRAEEAESATDVGLSQLKQAVESAARAAAAGDDKAAAAVTRARGLEAKLLHQKASLRRRSRDVDGAVAALRQALALLDGPETESPPARGASATTTGEGEGGADDTIYELDAEGNMVAPEDAEDVSGTSSSGLDSVGCLL